MEGTERPLMMLQVLGLNRAPSLQIAQHPDAMELPLMLGASLTLVILKDQSWVKEKS